MLIEERRRQVSRALQSIKGLSRDDRQAIAALDLPLSDSLVVAHLKLADALLARDSLFDWKRREESWHAWRAAALEALEAALRYRENDSLVVAVAACAALFPAVRHGAWLMAYKILDDVVSAAQRSGHHAKRERYRQRVRARDCIMRVSLWVESPERIYLDRDLNPAEREALAASGARETWGLALNYPDYRYVMRVVGCVIPVWWVARDGLTLITPAT